MATRKCGWCGVLVQMDQLEWLRLERRDGLYTTQGAFACPNPDCLKMSVASYTGRTYPSNPASADELLQRLGQWSPATLIGRDYSDVPQQIGSTADEAHRSASGSMRRGAILLARTAIEATAKDKGVDSGNLKSKIDKLAEQGFIRQNIARAAHEVRLAGNDMAHGDLGVDPDDEDVEQMLQLMDLVLREVYETPALIETVASKRESNVRQRVDDDRPEKGTVRHA